MDVPDRQRIGSGTPFEALAGYSRAILVGDRLLVAGTTATDEDGRVQAVGDAAEQTRIALRRIEHALEEAGASLAHVVRTRLYVTRTEDAAAVMRVHGAAFADIRPAATLVVVAALVDADMLVEIEAEAAL